jgi:hypothetical protein
MVFGGAKDEYDIIKEEAVQSRFDYLTNKLSLDLFGQLKAASYPFRYR